MTNRKATKYCVAGSRVYRLIGGSAKCDTILYLKFIERIHSHV